MGKIVSDVEIGISTDKDSTLRKVGRTIRRHVKQILTTSNMDQIGREVRVVTVKLGLARPVGIHLE